MTQAELLTKLRALMPELRREYGVTELILFGSYARNAQRPDSDVDLIVSYNKPLGFEFIDMIDRIEAGIGRKVDLVSRSAIRPEKAPFMLKHIVYV